MTSKLSIVFLLVLLTFAWAPLLAPGYFKGHDAAHSVFFLVEFDQGIRDGALYPRWGTDHALGYGYPIFSLYAPLAFYIAEVFNLLGTGATVAVKIVFGLATVLAGLAMFGLTQHLWGRPAALVSATAYVYIPYHLVDLYVRGALAEYCAFVFFPLTIWTFDVLIAHSRPRNLVLAALSYAGLLLTHNVSALLFSPVLVLWVLYRLIAHHGWQLKRLWRPTLVALAAGLLAVTLSAVYLLPMLVEQFDVAREQWTQATYNYADHFVLPAQLLSPFWGYGYAVPGPEDRMPLQLGLMPVLLSLWAMVHWPQLPRSQRGPAIFLALVTGGVILLMLPLSRPLWDAVPLASLAQFPWRLLMLTAVTLSALAGVSVASGCH